MPFGNDERYIPVPPPKPTCANCLHCGHAEAIYAHICRKPGYAERKVAPNGRCDEWEPRA